MKKGVEYTGKVETCKRDVTNLTEKLARKPRLSSADRKKDEKSY